MTHPHEYTPTLFDRHGPAAADFLRAGAYGAMVAGAAIGALAIEGYLSMWTVLGGLAAGAVVCGCGLALSRVVGSAWKHVAVDGATTPYTGQFSYEQALVMRGRVDEAIASFEAIIQRDATAVTARIRAAELYERGRGDAQCAAELFREAQRIESCSTGERVYVAHRLVDLYTGPLNQPGRALVELRRLIEQYPDHPAAAQARDALATLKTRYQAELE